MSKPNLWHDSEAGWIPHAGSECPINRDTMVRLQFRCGKVSEKEYRAGNWLWRKRGWDFDIVAYLITGEPE